MSAAKRKAKREAKLNPPKAEAPGKAKGRRRWRVAIVLVAVGLTMLFVALIGGLQPPLVTLYNKTGGVLSDVAVKFPGGEGRSEPIPDGGKFTVTLRPAAGAAVPAGGPTLRIDARMPDGKTVVIRSFVLGKERGAHEVFVARPMALGGFEVVYQAQNGPKFSLADLLRRVGIRI